jgi:hypothetical protein
VLQATQYDNQDRYALATLTVSRVGAIPRELQFLQKNYLVGVLENAPVNSILLTAVTNNPRDKVGTVSFWNVAESSQACSFSSIYITSIANKPCESIHVADHCRILRNEF